MKKTFVFPCNPERFDIAAHFKVDSQIVWRRPSDIECGDTVYIYVGKTIREIKYRCIVISVDVSKELLENNSYAISKGKIASKCSYILLRLDKTYLGSTFPLAELKSNGMGQFMVPMHVKN